MNCFIRDAEESREKICETRYIQTSFTNIELKYKLIKKDVVVPYKAGLVSS